VGDRFCLHHKKEGSRLLSATTITAQTNMAEREAVIIIGAIILVLDLYIEYTKFYADTPLF
jgi:hypothetical protein